jgi:monofunctional biosynthetic peptidoglycan transglycosylase
VVRGALLAVVALYAAAALALLVVRFVRPPTTMVRVQRWVEARVAGREYDERQTWRDLAALPRHVPRAVVAAEDTRFYEHAGFDWVEVKAAGREAARAGERPRGASTITQQLVKNLFLTTHRSVLRKGVEVALTPVAELVLPKERILELYLNEIEWGPGVFGVEAAARHHYGVSATKLTRSQATRLAAVIPAPRVRQPARMGWYARIIDGRMRAMGW